MSNRVSKSIGRLGRIILATVAIVACIAFRAQANGIDRNGVGARAMSMGGTETGWAIDPLGAMAANPAGLAFLTAPEADLGLTGVIPDGHFSKPPTSESDLNTSPTVFPDAAFGWPVRDNLTLGLSFVPESFMMADWHYVDPPGGLGGVSYGDQPDNSEITVLRSALGAGLKFNEQFSLGASVGLVYNENHLQTPYVFQNMNVSPGFNGAKTLLNLRTCGIGWNIQAGALYRPMTNLQFGLSYKSATTVNSTGDASGDPYAQFAVSPGPLAFHYDAGVHNVFPREVSLGSSWKFLPHWRAALQVDWINWADAFKTLHVSLHNGNNTTVNSVLGSAFTDDIPLNWKDEFVYRAGLEYEATEHLTLRAGYCYGQSPVPDSTLSPLTAAILEQTITFGAGYQWGRWDFDAAYQYDLPVTRNVGTSGLLSGEYSNSSVEASLHWLALTARVHF